LADLSYDDVRKILAIIDASTLDEIHIEIGDLKLEVRRRGSAPRAQFGPGPAARAARSPDEARAERSAPAGAQLAPGQFAVTAPMLGTFYRAPAPDAPPFIEIGSVVNVGDTLCIIEVMKLMNTIKAERAGRVAAIPAQNATMVEFGQPLVILDAL
jgi:acetyl-CoA carboxylase biotin carboxyl carrier protein